MEKEEDLLAFFLEQIGGGQEAHGLVWYKIPISPYEAINANIAQMLTQYMIVLRSMLAHLDISSGKERQLVDMIQNSIYIIQICLAVECPERPPIQRASSLFVPFKTQDAMQRGGRAHLRRNRCYGYLLIAVRPAVSGYARFIMSMTVWKRYMCDASGNRVRAQEHALIMKNFLVPDAPRRMAMRMHSFAADTVGQPLVVCNPYATMGEILQEFIRQHQIPKGQAKQCGYDQPCIAFGSGKKLENTTALRQYWKK